MAALYTKAADRAELAAEHMGKLSKTGTSIPSPHGKVRGNQKKDPMNIKWLKLRWWGKKDFEPSKS